MKKLFIIIFAVLTYMQCQSQGIDCLNADPFCTGTTYLFPAQINVPNLGTYQCLMTTPNAAWYYMQIANPGNINIYMQSNPLVDIDFACWGPFTTVSAGCATSLQNQTAVSCSYSTAATETCVIPNGQTGEIYILLITNYSNTTCNIQFSQTSGTGTTNCGILAPPVSNNGPLCVGSTLNLSAQAGAAGCTYYWTGPNGFVDSLDQNPVIPNVTLAMAGDYFLQIILAGDTSNIVSTTVVIYPIPTSTFTVSSDSVCINEQTTLNYTGTASASATYSWDVDGGTPNLIAGPGPHNISWAGTGLVNVSLTVAENGCTSPPTSFPVFVKPIPTSSFDISPNDSICLVDTLTIAYTGTAPANATYNWNFSGGNVISGSGQGPYHVKWSTPGFYSLSLSVIQDGCSSDTTFKSVTVLPLPVIYINAHPKEGCNPITVSFADSTANAAQWNWTFNGGNPGTSTNENPINIIYNNPGTFSVTLHVVDIYGCKNTATFNNYITSYPVPNANFTFNPNPGAPDLPINFNSSSSSTFVTNWNWNFGDAGTSTLQNPTHPFSSAGTYTIWLVVETAHGCLDSTSNEIKIVDVVIPNVFTPNNDGINEFFFIKGIDAVPDCQLIVFNRWGNKVYESNSYKNDWDGKGVADGVYYFILTFKDNLIKTKDNKYINTTNGTVTIIR